MPRYLLAAMMLSAATVVAGGASLAYGQDPNGTLGPGVTINVIAPGMGTTGLPQDVNGLDALRRFHQRRFVPPLPSGLGINEDLFVLSQNPLFARYFYLFGAGPYVRRPYMIYEDPFAFPGAFQGYQPFDPRVYPGGSGTYPGFTW